MPRDSSIRHVLIIGSGPIIIGQACEFDYSGSQASRSLREEGITVSLINSNPATIMTDPVTADRIYLKPLNPQSIREILEADPSIDSVLPTMGGQTALNLCKETEELGIWEQYGVRQIGVDMAAVELTENREEFRKLMGRIGVPVARSRIANSFLEGKEIAQEIGLPIVIRPSYTLGGSGGGIVFDKSELDEALKRGLTASPTHEVLVEQAVLGWKEFELELLRDSNDNVVIICTVENVDPMGVHTGDSITVAPAMTLSDRTYQRMRTEAIKMMRAMGDFAGGCNVQFAVNPDEPRASSPSRSIPAGEPSARSHPRPPVTPSPRSPASSPSATAWMSWRTPSPAPAPSSSPRSITSSSKCPAGTSTSSRAATAPWACR
jgi:carbamoyl-phosphate synthase large subunit